MYYLHGFSLRALFVGGNHKLDVFCDEKKGS